MMRQIRVGDWTWENDHGLQEFKQLMMEYELERSMLMENMLPYYDCYGDLRVPRIEQEAAPLKERYANAQSALVVANNKLTAANTNVAVNAAALAAAPADVDLQQQAAQLQALVARLQGEADALQVEAGELQSKVQEEEVIFAARRRQAEEKWNNFEALVNRIVECEYQKRHYTPIVQDTTEFGVRLHFTNNPFPTIVTSSPLLIAQCTLKQALLNGPFTSYQ